MIISDKTKILKFITVLLIVFYTSCAQAFFMMPDMTLVVGDFQNNIKLKEFVAKYQPDFKREKRIVSQIEDSVIDGDVVWLKGKGDSKDVFSIYTESEEDKAKGGVIVLHSRGLHANWETVVKPIRVGLSERGWHTLSVQMPVLDKAAKYYDYVSILPYSRTRIQAGIDFYQKQGIKKIVLIAHACGSHMAQDYIARYGTKDLFAFVGVGMGATDYRQKSIAPIILTLLDKDLPILDVVAQHDYPGVLRLANIRKAAFKTMKNPMNKQVVISNSEHYYQGDKASNAMVGSIAHWLEGL